MLCRFCKCLIMTIIFQSDWDRYPTAIPDIQTSNKTFLRLAQLYKSMGIRNHLFHLALLNPELQGVDPYDPNLDANTRALIVTECKYNIWYFMREVVRIAPMAGKDPVPLRANRGNVSMFWSFLSHVTYCLIQPRQTGKSVGGDCLSLWLMYAGAQNSSITLFTKDNSLRVKNVLRLKKMSAYLPKWLTLLTKDDADNQTELTCKARGNTYTTVVAQSNEDAALKVGRGFTSPVVHADEIPFIRFISTSLPALLASTGAVREEAELKGEPYGNIFTTTAGKLDDPDGRYIYDLINGGSIWNEVFLDAKDGDEFRALVDRNKTGRMRIINGTFSHRQLGYSDQWLKERLDESGASGEDADRDFFQRWTSGSQSNPLSHELLEKIRNSEMDPVFVERTKDLFMIRWYIPKAEVEERMWNSRFIAGMDTSDAIGRDSTTFVVIDVTDLSVVCTASVNDSNLMSIATFFADILIRYPNITVIPERKSSAMAIIDTMSLRLQQHGIDPFRRIFNHVVQNADERKNDFAEITRSANASRNYDAYRSEFGFVTNGESRKLLYGSVLQEMAKQSGQFIHDKPLIGEILGLVVKDGRIDHKTSGHDDHCFALLLAHWLATYGRNLRHYGIEPSLLKSMVSDTGTEMTPEEYYRKERARKAAIEIDDLLERLKNTENEIQIAQLEHQIANLTRYVSVVDTEVADNISAMVESVNEQRLQNARRRRPLTVGSGSSGYTQNATRDALGRPVVTMY